MLEIIGIYAAITGGTQDSIAQIDIPQDGLIRACDWDVHGDLDSDGESIQAELSFIATNQLTQSEVRGRISSVSTFISFTTSGISVISLQKFVGPFELVVSGGERMFVHVLTTAGVTGVMRVNLHFDGGAAVTRRSARR